MSTSRAWAFLSSQGLSILGSALSGIAIPWLLLEQDPGAGMASMVLSVQSVAAIAAMVLGALMIDRIDKRRFCMTADLTLCLALGLIIALYYLKLLTPLVIMLFVVLHAIMKSLSHAAETALIPPIAASSKMSNQRINGLIGVFHNGGDLLGPVVGGLIITSAGIAGALFLDAASFLASFLLFLFFIPASTGALAQASVATAAATGTASISNRDSQRNQQPGGQQPGQPMNDKRDSPTNGTANRPTSNGTANQTTKSGQYKKKG